VQANLHVCMHHTRKVINQPVSNQEHIRIYKIQPARSHTACFHVQASKQGLDQDPMAASLYLPRSSLRFLRVVWRTCNDGRALACAVSRCKGRIRGVPHYHRHRSPAQDHGHGGRAGLYAAGLYLTTSVLLQHEINSVPAIK